MGVMARRDATREEPYDFRQDAWATSEFMRARQKAAPVTTAVPALPLAGKWHPPGYAPEGPKPPPALLQVSVALGILVISTLMVLGFLSGGLRSLVGIASACVGTVALVGLLIAFIWIREERRWQMEWDDRLLEDAEDETVCIAELTILQDGAETGRDRGAVWFANGGLYFAGRRCSFAVGGQDLAEPDIAIDETEPETVNHVQLRHPSRTVVLQFKPLDHETEVRTRAKYGFFANMAKFNGSRPVSQDERQYPPLELDPEVKPSVVDRQPRVYLLICLVVTGVFGIAWGNSKDPFDSFSRGVQGFFALFGFWMGWKQIENKRRVVREIEAEKEGKVSVSGGAGMKK
jgi:hypothetical protein